MVPGPSFQIASFSNGVSAFLAKPFRCLLLCIVVAFSVCSQAIEVKSDDALLLKDSIYSVGLDSHFHFLDDASDLTDNEVIESYFLQKSGRAGKLLTQETWKKTGQGIRGGRDENEFAWLAVTVANRLIYETDFLLEVSSFVSDFTVIAVRNGRVVQQYRAGVEYPFEQRVIPHRFFLFPHSLAASDEVTLFIKSRTNLSGIISSSTIWQYDHFWHNDWKRTGFVFFFLGAVTILALLNGYAWMTTREKSYLYLEFVYIASLVNHLSGEGLIYQLFLTEGGEYNYRVMLVSVLLIFSGLGLFFLEYLEVKRKSNAVYRLYVVWIAFYLLMAVYIAVMGRGDIPVFWVVLSALPFYVVAWLFSALLWFKGDRLGRNFFLIFGVVILSVMIGILNLIVRSEELAWFYSHVRALGEIIAFSAMFLMLVAKINALKAAERKARALSSAKTEFVASMSHEIRTPMNGVLGMADLLSDTSLDETQTRYVKTIRNSGNALLTVINDILDFSKIESGKMSLESICFNLDEMVDDCIDVFGVAANEKNLLLHGIIKPGTPLVIKGDPNRLRQILINLVGNAIKFTEKGEVKIKVFNTREDLGDGVLMPCLRFEVCDSGIGLTRAEQQKLFRSFTQVDASISRKYGGTGLGLTISKRLVGLMKGHIGVESEPGFGSTFWFTLPLMLPEPHDQQPEVMLAGELQGCRLLVIEDNDTCCAMLQAMAETWKMELTIAQNIATAKDTLTHSVKRTLPFELILIDKLLPDGDGMAFSIEIRDIDGYQDAKIVLMTVSRDLPSQKVLSEHGIISLLSKPLTSRSVHDGLAHAIGADVRQLVDNKEHQEDHSALKVMVAEDNQINRMVISGMLKKMGVKAVFAEDGLAAVDTFKASLAPSQEPFQLIFMDCEMPQLDGYEATRKIRKLIGTKMKVKIIGLSAHAMAEHKQKALDAGMDDYITKPVSKESLSQALKDQ